MSLAIGPWVDEVTNAIHHNKEFCYTFQLIYHHNAIASSNPTLVFNTTYLL